MVCAERTVGDVKILDIQGKVTLGEGREALRGTVSQLLKEGHRKILLNFANMTYADSSGYGEFVSSYTTTSNAGGRLIIYNLSQKAAEMLSITKLMISLEVAVSEEEAMAAFKTGIRLPKRSETADLFPR